MLFSPESNEPTVPIFALASITVDTDIRRARKDDGTDLPDALLGLCRGGNMLEPQAGIVGEPMSDAESAL